MKIELLGTGEVAQRVRLTRAQLQYRLARGDVSATRHRVSGRRVFTGADVKRIQVQVRILRREGRIRSPKP